MKQYLDMLKHVYDHGVEVKNDRTGVGTIKVHGGFMRFDLTEGFPIVTTKYVNFKSVAAELLWFLSGSTDNNELNKLGTKIWDPWALPDGRLGPIYGAQWRKWDVSNKYTVINKLKDLVTLNKSDTIDVNKIVNLINEVERENTEYDQIEELLHTLKTNPDDRRMVVIAWNPEFLPSSEITPQENILCGKACLPACHTLFQVTTIPLKIEKRIWYAKEQGLDLSNVNMDKIEDELDNLNVPKRYINLSFYARSQDLMIGTPYNISSYALLLSMLGHVTNMIPKDLVWIGGDCHIYKNHIDGLMTQLIREPYSLPKLKLNPDVNNLFDFTLDDMSLEGYQHHDPIKLPVAV